MLKHGYKSNLMGLPSSIWEHGEPADFGVVSIHSVRKDPEIHPNATEYEIPEVDMH